MIHPSPLLRQSLLADAVISGGMALLLIVAAGLLAPWLALPAAFLRNVGLFLVAYVAFVGWVARRTDPGTGLVWAVIALNAAWVVASISLLFTELVAPSLLGQLFIAAQALVVGLFAELQYIGLRRSGAQLPA